MTSNMSRAAQRDRERAKAAKREERQRRRIAKRAQKAEDEQEAKGPG